MSFEALEGGRPNPETSATGQEVVLSMEAPDIDEPENWLAVASIKAQLKSEVDEEKPKEQSIYSTNTSKGDAKLVLKDKGNKRKAHNNTWWYMRCKNDGDERWVCSLKGEQCTDWRK